MKRTLVLILVISVFGCGSHGGGSDSAVKAFTTPLPPNPTADLYARGLVTEDFNSFAIKVRSAVDMARRASDVEVLISNSEIEKFEAGVQDADKKSAKELQALQDQGVALSGKLASSNYLVISGDAQVAELKGKLSSYFEQLDRVCRTGRYESIDELTKRSSDGEQVKSYYRDNCSARSKELPSIPGQLPFELSAEENKKFELIEARWSEFEGRKQFSSAEISDILSYAIDLRAHMNMFANSKRSELPMQKLRIDSAQTKLIEIMVHKGI